MVTVEASHSGCHSVGSGIHSVISGRAGEIRTHDLLHPMQAFYQAELRPDLFAGRCCHCPAGGRILMRPELFATKMFKPLPLSFYLAVNRAGSH